MATNNGARWIGNLLGLQEPLRVPGLFAAGASVPVKAGELLELTGGGSTQWVPMDSDFDMSTGLVAVAAVEVKSGDLAGYYPIIVPRDGDVFEFDLLSSDSQAPAIGTAVYWSTSERVTTTAGTNILGNVAGWEHYPLMQGFASDDASPDRGTTVRSVAGGKVRITIQRSNSYLSKIQTA